jgi:probable rRNA maturation factor
MTYQVDIQNDDGYAVDAIRLQAAASCVLAQEAAQPDCALTIVLMDDAGVARLNAQFRGVDAPTDVLSFPADAPSVAMPDEPPYLGDLVIAYPYAAAQAARETHALEDSLSLLVVHGVLHLLGHDHDTPERRASMWAAQAHALGTLNVPQHVAPSLEDVLEHDHDTK